MLHKDIVITRADKNFVPLYCPLGNVFVVGVTMVEHDGVSDDRWRLYLEQRELKRRIRKEHLIRLLPLIWALPIPIGVLLIPSIDLEWRRIGVGVLLLLGVPIVVNLRRINKAKENIAKLQQELHKVSREMDALV